jgi:hypothetical protein
MSARDKQVQEKYNSDGNMQLSLKYGYILTKNCNKATILNRYMCCIVSVILGRYNIA